MKYYEPIWNSGILEIYEIWMIWICLRIWFTPKMAAFFPGNIMLNHGMLGYPFSNKPIWGKMSEESEASVAPKNSQVNIVNTFI